ncbi:hypothetical protein ACFWP3_41545 [Streptomyces sp. NPDC058525]|uniref:hypothetical protein n=1 Tax=Streptomyces sp. NPDC058525 TaxID=3346538 RepID=UPI0036471DA5
MTLPEPTLTQDLDAVPEGTRWPEADTLVLLSRDLRPDTDHARLSRFADDRWDLNPAIFEDHKRSTSLNFELMPGPLRQAAKHYIWQLINHDRPKSVRGRTPRQSMVSIGILFTAPLQAVLTWFAAHGVRQFCEITPVLLDDYLEALREDEVSVDRRYRRITEVRRLWAYRDVLPPSMRLPDAPPWGGEDTKDLLGRTRGDRENLTPRIGEARMQTLLHWAVRFVEDFSQDILAAHTEQLERHSRTPEMRRRSGTQGQGRHQKGELRAKVAAYLEDLRERGQPLPGRRCDDGRIEVRWRHIAAILNCSTSIQHTFTGQMITESGLPLSADTFLDAPITGLLDGLPWRERPVTRAEAPRLARLLSSACFIVVAYLSGARVGEVLNLRRGCVRHDKATGLWLMEGLYFKGVEDEDGNKIPAGQIRPDPWVVIEVVAQAVGVLERLHPSPLLFPKKIEPHHLGWKVSKRRGQARSDRAMAGDLEGLVSWINDECGRLGRTDHIPDDGRGPLAPSRFRRTLAWFIRRRPRGLIAATVQYGHAHTRMLQGYAGTYDSGFPDEYAFEDWLFRIEGLAEDERELLAGEHVSGPAADTYRSRVTAANREFAGRVLARDRQARDLLGNPLLQIHHGEGMTCVFDPTTAACQIRGTAEDPMVTPDTDDCRPKCPNLARTDRDIEYVRRQAKHFEDLVADPLAPPIRHERERHELTRLKSIIDIHDQGHIRP